jgi:chitin disaccharide deacetylase
MAGVLVVNADDFGLTDGINEGVVRAHRHGIVTSASLMVQAPRAAAGAALAAGCPELSVGLHFVERPAADIDDPATLARELDTQLELFSSLLGRPPTHIDGHHHVQLEGERHAVFTDVADRLGIPVRGHSPIRYIGGFYGQWEWGVTDLSHVSVEYLIHLLREEVIGGRSEIACHPAASLAGLRSDYHHERLVELGALTDPRSRAAVAELGITLRNFDGILSDQD